MPKRSQYPCRFCDKEFGTKTVLLSYRKNGGVKTTFEIPIGAECAEKVRNDLKNGISPQKTICICNRCHNITWGDIELYDGKDAVFIDGCPYCFGKGTPITIQADKVSVVKIKH